MTEESSVVEEEEVVTTKQRLAKRAFMVVYALWSVIAVVVLFLLVKGIIEIAQVLD